MCTETFIHKSTDCRHRRDSTYTASYVTTSPFCADARPRNGKGLFVLVRVGHRARVRVLRTARPAGAGGGAVTGEASPQAMSRQHCRMLPQGNAPSAGFVVARSANIALSLHKQLVTPGRRYEIRVFVSRRAAESAEEDVCATRHNKSCKSCKSCPNQNNKGF